MATNIQERIRDYMNARSHKCFTVYDVAAMTVALKKEYVLRKKAGIELNPKSKEGKHIINVRMCELLKHHQLFTVKDIELFKKCRNDEYADRTGKCVYGYKEVRKRLGYDTETGEELVE